VLAKAVTVQVTPLEVVQPVQDKNELPPTVGGAVRVTDAPAEYVRVKPVEPLAAPLTSGCETPMETPLAGFVELTVIV
jgi:hypothetical protein